MTEDPTGDGIARPGVIGIVQPDDGDTPFQMQVSGIQVGTPELDEIVSTNTTSGLKVPYGDTYSGTSSLGLRRLSMLDVGQGHILHMPAEVPMECRLDNSPAFFAFSPSAPQFSCVSLSTPLH